MHGYRVKGRLQGHARMHDCMPSIPGHRTQVPRRCASLRIMAPHAPKWATLEKDDATDARTVVQRIPFDFKDERRLHMFVLTLLLADESHVRRA